MKELAGRTAVVTGAASGIGRALADAFAAEDMAVVLADVEVEPLEAAGAELRDRGAAVETVCCDVADRGDVVGLAEAAYHVFGAVHVVCNNAGVAGPMGPIWEATDKDWTWVLGVNLMGVVHGIQAFVPRMLAGGQEGHVVNTSSVLGLSGGSGSIYSVTKHAVTRLTEGLWHDLKAAGAPISASVLCPGMIATRIVTADRNRPAHLRDGEPDPAMGQLRDAVQAHFLAEGMPPAEVAAMVVDAVRTDRFWVLTHPEQIKPQVDARARSVIADTDPPAVDWQGIAARNP